MLPISGSFECAAQGCDRLRIMYMLRSAISSALVAAAAFILVPGHAAEPDPKIVTYTAPDNIAWRKGRAADTATVQGDPSKPGIYIQLIKWHPGNMSRPHFHSTDRYITVLSGTWWIGTGPKYDPAKSRQHISSTGWKLRRRPCRQDPLRRC
jgi:hypothetical protein